MKPIVALVGRPNVGKSALFNRIIGERRAIVEDTPGTTRDRLYADAEWAGIEFLLVDTGGLEALDRAATVPALGADSAAFLPAIRQQAQVAIDEADVIVFLTDVRAGVTAADMDVADLLRKTEKPVILAVNKADSQRLELGAADFWSLGLGEPYPVSAFHGRGVGDLLDAVVQHLPSQPAEEEPDAVHIAIVGRPNVGKSSLLNALLGQERAIVSEVPGTTRDAIDTRIEWEGEHLVLIDTAGIRRRGRIEHGAAEQYSVLRALRAIERADVVLLLIDATEGVTAQDAHIAGYAVDRARSIVLVVNKWDAVEKDSSTMAAYTRALREAFDFVEYAPVLFISAKTRQRVNQVLPTALRVYHERAARITTGELNRLIQEAIVRHPPPPKGGRPLRFFYVTQAASDPPTFVLFVNDPEMVHFSYLRYIENTIRERYPFEGTPIRLEVRARGRGGRSRGRRQRQGEGPGDEAIFASEGDDE